MTDEFDDPGEVGLVRQSWLSAAQRLLMVGQKDKAIEVALEAIGRNPDDPDAQRTLAEVLVHCDKHAEALVAADEAVRLDPDEDASHYARALALIGLAAVQLDMDKLSSAADNLSDARTTYNKYFILSPKITTPSLSKP